LGERQVESARKGGQGKGGETDEGVHVGDRVAAFALADEVVTLGKPDGEHIVKPASLVLVALDGVRDLLGRVAVEVVGLALTADEERDELECVSYQSGWQRVNKGSGQGHTCIGPTPPLEIEADRGPYRISPSSARKAHAAVKDAHWMKKSH
jgi:hypothetical protein